MERTEGHMVMNCSRSEPSSPAWGGELSSQRAAGRFLPEEWLTYLDFCQLPLVVLGHRKYRVLGDGLPHPLPEGLQQPQAHLHRVAFQPAGMVWNGMASSQQEGLVKKNFYFVFNMRQTSIGCWEPSRSRWRWWGVRVARSGTGSSSSMASLLL